MGLKNPSLSGSTKDISNATTYALSCLNIRIPRRRANLGWRTLFFEVNFHNLLQVVKSPTRPAPQTFCVSAFRLASSCPNVIRTARYIRLTIHGHRYQALITGVWMGLRRFLIPNSPSPRKLSIASAGKDAIDLTWQNYDKEQMGLLERTLHRHRPRRERDPSRNQNRMLSSLIQQYVDYRPFNE